MIRVIFSVTLLRLGILALAMIWLLWVLGKKENWLRERIRHFECGLESRGNARGVFSIRFYFLLILFLIFDMELIFLIFFFVDERYVRMFRIEIVMIFFLFGLFGFFEEWRRGALAWVW